MAMALLRRLCLLAWFLAGAPRAESPALQMLDAGAAENVWAPRGAARALSAPLLAPDGRLIACSGSNLLAFERNGSVAWVVPLGHRCNGAISPVTEHGKVYLVADDRILKVTPRSVRTSEPPISEVFFGYNAAPGRSEEIVGFSVSGAYSSLFLTIRNRGLFVLSLRTREMQWSLGPVMNRFGYRLGCKRNISGCYFDSAPIVDHCEGVLYVSNTEGQLYSLYILSRRFRWIQDFSSFDKVMTVAPGNSERLYIVFPRKSLVVGLDVSTGTISWQRNVGPLSNEKVLPAVDSNGWMSVGSLDGILYSISPDGDVRKFLERTAPGSVIRASPVLDCSGFSMYAAQTIMEAKSSRTIGDCTRVSAMKSSSILFTLLAPATGTIYWNWTAKYPGELSNLLPGSDPNYFTEDETILLSVLSAARIGNTMPCYTRRQKIAWTCAQAKTKFPQTDPGVHNHVFLLLFFLLVVIVILAVSVLSCCIFWRKKKLQGNDLQKFLEKRRSLHSKRRVLGKMIKELEQKAVEDASSHETLDRLGEMVKAKEGVERKLCTSYSLGRDSIGMRHGSSILPLYHGEYRSHSFHNSQDESVTIFNTFSDTSTSNSGTSSCSEDSESCSTCSSGDMEPDVRHGSAGEAGPSDIGDLAEVVQGECRFVAGSPSRIFTNPELGGEITERSSSVLAHREEVMDTMPGRTPIKRIFLKRRRTFN